LADLAEHRFGEGLCAAVPVAAGGVLGGFVQDGPTLAAERALAGAGAAPRR
jgi:hypothetical protein